MVRCAPRPVGIHPTRWPYQTQPGPQGRPVQPGASAATISGSLLYHDSLDDPATMEYQAWGLSSYSITKIKNRSVAELYLNYIKSPSSTPTFNLCQDWGLSPKTASVVLAAPSVAAAAVAAAPGPPSEAPPGLGSRS